jgi:hypothetical protein
MVIGYRDNCTTQEPSLELHVSRTPEVQQKLTRHTRRRLDRQEDRSIAIICSLPSSERMINYPRNESQQQTVLKFEKAAIEKLYKFEKRITPTHLYSCSNTTLLLAYA